MSQGGGDAGLAAQAQEAEGGVSQGGHDLRSGVGANLGAVFVEGDVADPSVLDPPVPAQPGRDLSRVGVGPDREVTA
jgi:hypothetical protein